MHAFTESRGQEYLAKLWLKKTDFWHSNKDKVLLKLISGNEILDIGCGAGTISAALARLGKNVTAIDNYKPYLDLAKQKNAGLKIKYVCGDCTKYKFNKKFDAIVLSGVLEHVKGDKLMLEKIHGLLRTGGRLVLLTSAYSNLYSNFDKSVGHYRRYDEAELRSLLESCGFKIAKLKYWDALGLLVLHLSKLTGHTISSETMGNRLLDAALNIWFRLVENNMPFKFGADIITVAVK